MPLESAQGLFAELPFAGAALLPLLALVPALVSGAAKKANALDVEADIKFPSHNAFASK